jgi:hypothetical protein
VKLAVFEFRLIDHLLQIELMQFMNSISRRLCDYSDVVAELYKNVIGSFALISISSSAQCTLDLIFNNNLILVMKDHSHLTFSSEQTAIRHLDLRLKTQNTKPTTQKG